MAPSSAVFGARFGAGFLAAMCGVAIRIANIAATVAVIARRLAARIVAPGAPGTILALAVDKFHKAVLFCFTVYTLTWHNV